MIEWTLMEDGPPPPDTVCAVMLRYMLERPPFATVDTWAMQREDPIGMGGPTIETGYGWDDNWEADVLAWIALPEFSADDLKRCARCDEEAET